MQSFCSWIFAFLILFTTCVLNAQDSTRVEFSGYAEFYWSYQQGGESERPAFLYNHTSNGAALNVAWMKYIIQHKRWQLIAAPMAGTYVRRNMVSEPNAAKHIYEASLGFRISNNSRIDAGILPSHIGVESSYGAQQLNVTRSLLAENTPYYECGLRWSGETKFGLNWAILLLNGWQRIALDDNRNWPAFGAQIQHVKKNGHVLNYSNYLGTIGDRMTIYHNFFGQWQIAQDWKVETQLNYESVPLEKDFVGYSIAGGRAMGKKFAAALRLEQMIDNRGLFFSTTLAPKNLNPGSTSVNIDYSPIEKLKSRIEVRRLWSANKKQFETVPITSAMWLITATASVSF